jgi:UDP-N-acetylglucosamine--N-acetylmuramyl-(pentapeptide) pyrophosphoryl-undecaprenol N-acetylglucosamine transferase
VKVVLAGGGTAGHVEPALATADAVRRAEPGAQITLLGTERGLETRLVPERGYELALIPPVPLPRRLTVDLVRIPARVRGSVRQATTVLREREAEVLVGFGGYVALPAYLAARRVGIPIVVHEANARPGLANRIGARLTSHVAVASPGVQLAHGEHVGIPLRRSIAQLDRDAQRAEAQASFGLSPDKPTLLVFGGSQGARRLNDTIVATADAVLEAGAQILHAVGAGNIESVTPKPSYVPVPYIDRMDLAYAAADLVLCRAGAMTCAELAAVGLPAVYVPLPHGNGEQQLNAEPTVAAGGGVLIRDSDLTPDEFTAAVVPLLQDRDRLLGMGDAAATLGRRDADDHLVRIMQRAVQAATDNGAHSGNGTDSGGQ